jgi:hypothetical protein
VVELLGVRARQADVACHRVLVHLDQATGGPGAATLADVFEQRDGLVLGQPGVFQGGPFALGKGPLAGAAVDHADPLACAGPTAEIKVALVALARVRASRILAAEVFDGLHPESSRHSNSLAGLDLGLPSLPTHSTRGCLL